jgi:hypothetical protein
MTSILIKSNVCDSLRTSALADQIPSGKWYEHHATIGHTTSYF